MTGGRGGLTEEAANHTRRLSHARRCRAQRQYGPVLDILLVTFPFFALVLCGYVAARRRMLPLEAIPGLNTFVLYFALPCMLYRFGATTPIAQLLDGGRRFRLSAVRAGAGRRSLWRPA